MRLLGESAYALLAARGEVLVVMETSAATCSACGGKIAKNTRGIYAWDDKRHAQPSRLHVEGEGKVTVRHERCARSAVS